MELIGAALAYQRNDAARGAAELGGHGVREHLEFLRRVNRKKGLGAGDGELLAGDAIDQKAVRQRRAATNRDGRQTPTGEHLSAEEPDAADRRDQVGEAQGIAAVERQFFHLPSIHYGAERRGIRLQ